MKCDNETMSEIYAIWFGGHTRKFENFWIFELACGPGSRKFENHKFTDVCENMPIFAIFSIFAKIYRFFCENLPIFARICRFLRKSADFCENLPIFAKICIFFAKICRFLRKFAYFFCENSQIFAKSYL